MFLGPPQESGPVEMKITDDYRAKMRLWAANPAVVPATPPADAAEIRAAKILQSRGDEPVEKRAAPATLARNGPTWMNCWFDPVYL